MTHSHSADQCHYMSVMPVMCMDNVGRKHKRNYLQSTFCEDWSSSSVSSKKNYSNRWGMAGRCVRTRRCHRDFHSPNNSMCIMFSSACQVYEHTDFYCRALKQEMIICPFFCRSFRHCHRALWQTALSLGSCCRSVCLCECVRRRTTESAHVANDACRRQ